MFLTRSIKNYVLDQIDKSMEFHRQRYWDLYHKHEVLVERHEQLLTYLGLEQKEIPKGTIIVRRDQT